MYLDELRLKNYRSFKGNSFKFSKITLLLGPNSGGKTSVFAAVLSALQSDRFPLYFSPNGELVETGDYREIVSSHRVGDDITIELIFSVDGSNGSSRPVELKGVYSRDGETSMPQLVNAVALGSVAEWNVSRQRNKYKFRWEYYSDRDSRQQVESDFPELAKAVESMLIRIESDDSSGQKSKRKGRSQAKSHAASLDSLPNSGTNEGPLHTISRVRGSATIWANMAINESLNLTKNFASRFSYIGSHRLPPQRTYYYLVGSDLKVGVSGQNTIEQILAWENNKSPNLQKLTSVLKRIGLASRLAPNKLAGGRFEVKVKVPGSSVGSSLADVGFGINQFLPVLVAELQQSDGATIAISQPETHLHPSVQAEIASHFASQVKNRGFRYIVETHSEYLLNRLRRLIRKGELASEDVAVYYVEPSQAGACVHQITLEKSGQIKGAPPGFFATYQMDVMNIAFKR
jgi:hypothetical protein